MLKCTKDITNPNFGIPLRVLTPNVYEYLYILSLNLSTIYCTSVSNPPKNILPGDCYSFCILRRSNLFITRYTTTASILIISYLLINFCTYFHNYLSSWHITNTITYSCINLYPPPCQKIWQYKNLQNSSFNSKT